MSRRKPTVYVDTNIFSIYYFRGHDVVTRGWRLTTRSWWAQERTFFKIYGSEHTEFELAQGIYPTQKQAVAMLKRLPYLPMIREAKVCARRYEAAKIVPETEPGDAIQLAMATVHRMDYLLTWNYAHLVNAETQRRLGEINNRMGFRTPILASPESMPKARLWQPISRKD